MADDRQNQLAMLNTVARARVAAFLRYALDPDHPDSVLGRQAIFDSLAESALHASMFIEVMANHALAVMLVGADGDHDTIRQNLAELGDTGAMTDIYPQPTE